MLVQDVAKSVCPRASIPTGRERRSLHAPRLRNQPGPTHIIGCTRSSSVCDCVNTHGAVRSLVALCYGSNQIWTAQDNIAAISRRHVSASPARLPKMSADFWPSVMLFVPTSHTGSSVRFSQHNTSKRLRSGRRGTCVCTVIKLLLLQVSH